MRRLPIRVPCGPATCGWCYRPATSHVELRSFWRSLLGLPGVLVACCAHCAAERLAARR